jgi:inosine-uridine nucleoside N-ribohydrolase
MRTIALLLVFCFGLAAAAPVRVVFDTDIGNDVDDALALAILHRLESLGEAKILAVTVTKDCQSAAPYIDLVNTFYGRPDIPIGVVAPDVVPSSDTPMIRIPVEARKPDGSLLYPRKLREGRDAPEAVGLLENLLAKEEDGSVVLVQVGFSSNFARLMRANRALVHRKVRLLVAMAGAFPTGPKEFNVYSDIASAKALFAGWPTPIVASGFEVGKSILYPASSIENDFRYTAHHPIVDAYRAYKKMPYDRPTWDLTAALYAVRPDAGYFGLSAPGAITVDDSGITHFQEATTGRHRYLVVTPEQRRKVLEAMIAFASAPPSSH